MHVEAGEKSLFMFLFTYIIVAIGVKGRRVKILFKQVLLLARRRRRHRRWRRNEKNHLIASVDESVVVAASRLNMH